MAKRQNRKGYTSHAACRGCGRGVPTIFLVGGLCHVCQRRQTWANLRRARGLDT